MGKRIEARIVEILEKVNRRGVESLSPSERVAHDVSGVLYRVVCGLVGGLRYNVTGAARKRSLMHAKTLGCPEYSRWLENAFAPRLGAAAEDALDDEFPSVEENANAALLALLEREDQERLARRRPPRETEAVSDGFTPGDSPKKPVKKRPVKKRPVKKRPAKKKMRAKATSRR